MSFLLSIPRLETLHNTIEQICDTSLPFHPTTCTHLTLTKDYNLLRAGIFHSPPSNIHPVVYAPPHRTHYHYLFYPCDLAQDLTTFVYTDGSKKGDSAPLGAAATHPSSYTSLTILVTSIPPTHTRNRAKLVAIYLRLKLGHPTILSDSACSLRLIHKHIRSPHAMQEHPHREILSSIIHTLQTRTTACLTTHLGIIKAHNNAKGNDLADYLANAVADGNAADAEYYKGAHTHLGHWT
jgi:ribonuclease HI